MSENINQNKDMSRAEDSALVAAYVRKMFGRNASELQLSRIMEKLRHTGYLKDGVDRRFLKNKLLKEQISLLLNADDTDIAEKRYFLTDENGKQQMSKEKGTLGGYQGLSIYGRLDCRSALRHLALGHYAQSRVFFADEETAVSAGYRPCGICMREKYLEWKKNNAKQQQNG